MNRTKAVIIQKSFLSFLFLLTALFYFMKAESAVYAPEEFCYYGNATEIELVVASRPFDSHIDNLENESIRLANVLPRHCDFLNLYKLSLLHYEISVLHHLNSFDQAFTPSGQLNSILHKHHIWHQSSEDPPPLSS